MKLKPITLYCVVDKEKPKIKYENLIRASDHKQVHLFKGEKIIAVEVIAKK